jgi:hypothetical protein
MDPDQLRHLPLGQLILFRPQATKTDGCADILDNVERAMTRYTTMVEMTEPPASLFKSNFVYLFSVVM